MADILWKEDEFEELASVMPDRIIRLLGHNYMPTGPDLLLTKEYQQNISNNIDLIQQQIALLKEECNKLENQRFKYIKQTQACEVILSPIRRLPPEIVQEIACQAQNDCQIGTSRNPPVSMSHVCSSWRTAIINMPSLWTSLNINTKNTATRMNVITVIMEYAERAISLPLSIRLSLNDKVWAGAQQKYSQKLLYWLMFECAPIRRVHSLEIASFRFLDALVSGIGSNPAPFDKLETLTLKGGNYQIRPGNNVLDTTGWGNLFLNSPSLRKLSIGRNSIGDHLSVIHFPWEQITHLFLANPLKVGNWSTLIQTCKAIQNCYFHISDVDIGSNFSLDLPHLQKLSLRIEGFRLESSDCLRLLQKGSFPSLERLELIVSSVVHYAPLFENDNSRLKLSHLPSLSSFSFFVLPDADFPYNTFLVILHLCPSIVSLELGLPASTCLDIFDALIPKDGGTCLLPLLTSLAIQVTAPRRIKSSLRKPFFDPSCSLKLLGLAFVRTLPDKAYQQLRSLKLLLIQHTSYNSLADMIQNSWISQKSDLSFRLYNLKEGLESYHYDCYAANNWQPEAEIPSPYSITSSI